MPQDQTPADTTSETDALEWRDVAVIVPWRDGEVLVRPRPHQDPVLAGQLEFPGGHVEPREDPGAAAKRELWEETRLRAATVELLTRVDHRYPDRAVRIHFYFTADWAPAGPDAPRPPWRFISVQALAEAETPAANETVIQQLLTKLR